MAAKCVVCMNDKVAQMVGRKLVAVELSPERDVVTFTFQEGLMVSFKVVGDCCSQSWIEHLEAFPDMEGAVFVDLVEDPSEDATNDPRNPWVNSAGRQPEEKRHVPERAWLCEEYLVNGPVHREHTCLRVYTSRFRFDRGEVVLEYRNSSNGYYGGYLE